jgi:hypothetical protein
VAPRIHRNEFTFLVPKEGTREETLVFRQVVPRSIPVPVGIELSVSDEFPGIVILPATRTIEPVRDKTGGYIRENLREVTWRIAVSLTAQENSTAHTDVFDVACRWKDPFFESTIKIKAVHRLALEIPPLILLPEMKVGVTTVEQIPIMVHDPESSSKLKFESTNPELKASLAIDDQRLVIRCCPKNRGAFETVLSYSQDTQTYSSIVRGFAF